jgi:hypothetical protein
MCCWATRRARRVVARGDGPGQKHTIDPWSKNRVSPLRERVCVSKCNLDRVEPAERRKRDEHVDDTRNPLGKRVALWADIIFLIWSRGAWGC